MIIPVKTKFNGMVAFRDKYLKEAKEKKEPLQIECEGEIMSVPYEELDKRIRFTKPVPDHYSKEIHQLVYYWFVKDKATVEEKQIKLL